MKQFKFIAIFAMLVGIATTAVFVGCEKERLIDNADSIEKTKKSLSNIENVGDCGWCPEGTIIEEVDENTLFILANGWTYVGRTIDNGLYVKQDEQIKVSCTCNAGNGTCSPFYISAYGVLVGCGGSCSNCSMIQSAISGEFLERGGFINLNIEPHFVQYGEVLPGAFDEMFEIPEVQEKLDNFIHAIYENESEYPEIVEHDGYLEIRDEGYVFSAVNLCGRAVVIPVPKMMLRENEVSGDKYNCSCTAGSCTYKKTKVVVHYCEDNCNGTCSLTISSSLQELNNLQQAEFSAISFKY